MKYYFLLSILILLNYCVNSQNLIANGNFNALHSYNPDKWKPAFLNVKEWETENNELFNYTINFNSYLLGKKGYNKRYHNFYFYDNLYSNDTGMALFQLYSSPAFIQQKVSNIKKGRYCLKYKYKCATDPEKETIDSSLYLEIAISKRSIRETKKHTTFKKDVLVKIKPILKSDFNLPWINTCKEINLTGDEKYFIVGNFEVGSGGWSITKVHDHLSFLIDDIELRELKDTLSCNCSNTFEDVLNKTNYKTFKFDTVYTISGCNCTYHTPYGNGAIMDSICQNRLNEMVLFLKKNDNVMLNITAKNPTSTFSKSKEYLNYFVNFGIPKQRIDFSWVSDNYFFPENVRKKVPPFMELRIVEFVFTEKK